MKKIIRVLFFAFALVLFTGTVNAAKAPKYTLTVNYYDNLSGKVIKTASYDSNKKSEERNLYSLLGLSANNSLNYNVPGTKEYYIFQGWYTEDGTKVGAKAENATDVDGVSFYTFSASSVWLYVVVPELTENRELTIYGNWSDKIYKASSDIHVYDDKKFTSTEVTHYPQWKKDLAISATNGEGGKTVVMLDQVFTNNNEYYTAFNNNTLRVDVKGTASYYTFAGYFDSEGNEIKEGYTSNLIKSVRIYDKGNQKNTLEIVWNDCATSKVTEDIDFNITVKWTEFTTAILEHEYIDEVSTGSGSWSNSTGGTASYTHTFSNPEDGTPMTHYDFLYWQHEESDDEQVDSTKEYKAGDKFTYILSDKESGWKGKVTTYAWWQPDVTLNLYSDGKLFSSESSFTSVSITNEPTKYGYKFLGWYDKDGNKVTETTFYAAEKGINPEVREYTLYAKWERIMVDVKVSLVWDDNNNEDGVRPASVKVELKDGEEVIETVTLSEENNWTYTFNVPKYGEESEIEYTVSQEEVEYYVTTTTGSVEEGFVLNNFHEVWPKGQGGDDFEVVQTGNEVNYSLLLIGLFVELLFVKRKLFN